MRLEDAKVGDLLMYNISYSGTKRFTKITTILKTQVKCEDGHRYMKNDGMRVGTGGSSYRHRIYAQLIDEKARADYIEQQKMATRVVVAANTLREVKVTLDNLEKVEAFLEGLKA